jgi:hypothetical protein
MSGFGDEAENVCSHPAFQLSTRTGSATVVICLLGSMFANLDGNPADKRIIVLLTDGELPR